MADDELFQLPEHPFYSCEEDCFLVADGSQMGTAAAILALEPLLKLMVGEGNIFERRPVKVAEKEGLHVSVECDGGEVVHIDFDALTARKTTLGRRVPVPGRPRGRQRRHGILPRALGRACDVTWTAGRVAALDGPPRWPDDAEAGQAS